MSYDYDRRTAKAPQGRLDSGTRSAINRDLDKGGFGGAKRFRRMGEALNEAFSILAKYGIEPDEVLNAHTFNQSKGHRLIELALTNAADSFSPTNISNCGLAFSWHDLGDERFEVIAYIS
jgi:hypothetical protein